jgi:6-phosphogluconolactonase
MKRIILIALNFFCLISVLSFGQSKTAVPMFVGTYTNEGSEGIYRCWFDTINGKLSAPTLAIRLDNPSYLAISSDNRFLWAVGEMNNTYCLSSFSIDDKASLKAINQQVGEGSYSCYVSELQPLKWLGAASYGSGLVTLYPLNNDGSIGDLATVDKHWGKLPHAHCIVPDPNGKFIYSADLGIDKVLIYKIETGKLKPFGEILLPKGTGPRHIDFHPSGKWMSVVSELKSTVTIIARDTTQAFGQVVSQAKMLPATFQGISWAADIHFSPDGRFVYASNRGHNSITIFSFDNMKGEIKPVGWATEGINRPRNFTIDPSGKFLLVANQDGNDVVIFRRNAKTGLLSPINERVTISHPVCLKFFNSRK